MNYNRFLLNFSGLNWIISIYIWNIMIYYRRTCNFNLFVVKRYRMTKIISNIVSLLNEICRRQVTIWLNYRKRLLTDIWLNYILRLNIYGLVLIILSNILKRLIILKWYICWKWIYMRNSFLLWLILNSWHTLSSKRLIYSNWCIILGFWRLKY